MWIGNVGEGIPEEPGHELHALAVFARDGEVVEDAGREFTEHVGGDGIGAEDEPRPCPAFAPAHLLDGEVGEGEESK